MARATKTGNGADLTKILRLGGEAAPANLKSARGAALKRELATRFDKVRALERQGTKLLGELEGTRELGSARALDGLEGLHHKLAGAKVVAPGLATEVGGLIAGRFTVKVVPPFDYAITIPNVIAGAPAVSGGASTNGQLNGSAVTATTRGFNAGSWYSEMGVYFHPLSAGTISVSASPSFSYEWWTNSIDTQLVRSFGSVQLGIFTFDRLGNIGGGPASAAQQWDEQMTQQIRLDLGSSAGTPLSVHMDVSPTLVYALCISLDVHVEGSGWPGSLAGAVLAVNVPSITYTFDAQRVVATF